MISKVYELKLLRSWPSAELRKVTKNYRVSVDNFQWIDSGLSNDSERVVARHCRPVGTFSVRRGAWTPEPWADISEGGPGKQVTTTRVGPGNIHGNTSRWKLIFFQKTTPK